MTSADTRSTDAVERQPRWTHRIAWLTAVWAFLVVTTGGTITSSESGMADEAAPLFDNQLMPDFQAMAADGGLFVEHGHRIIVGLLGLLALACAISGWTKPGLEPLPASNSAPRRRVRVLALAVFLLVLPPAVLGALTVKYNLHPAFSLAHVSLAMFFIVASTSLSVITGPAWYNETGRMSPARARGLVTLALVGVVAVLVQIVLGGIARHATAEVGGSRMVGIGNALHICWAFVVFTVLLMLIGRIVGSHSKHLRLLRPAAALLALLVAQVFLGFSAFITQPKDPGPVVVEAGHMVQTGTHVVVASVHQSLGVLVLIATLVLFWRARRISRLSGVDATSPESSGDASRAPIAESARPADGRGSLTVGEGAAKS